MSPSSFVENDPRLLELAVKLNVTSEMEHPEILNIRPWIARSRCALRASSEPCCARVCVARARVREASACTLVIVLHTHVRVVRSVVLRRRPFPSHRPADPPVLLP